MDSLNVSLFPQGSLSSSVITTVWIGVMVVAIFNLRLGWVLSGLVVPGYMVPLLLSKPWSAGVVLVESIVTYLIVYTFSERGSKTGLWCSFFGRDRFFALVLTSVIVRLVFDSTLLPLLGELWTIYFDSQFDFRNNLHSFGLIIIALIANLFWKTGVARGLVPVIVTTAITYLIVRYGLLEFTNFSVSRLSYLYEDLAASILASPKAYIVLLTTAFIASRMNLLYGWDFNGILIPSLLALQWYQPLKILTSFTEAFVILGLGIVLLRLPLFANVNMEGARKLIFFFNIGFAYKLLLGFTLPILWPEIKVTDAFGFGYLLSTLVAIKMHDQKIVARLTRASLQTSLVSVGVASVIGFTLTFASDVKRVDVLPQTPGGASVHRVANQSIETYLGRTQIELHGSQVIDQIPRPLITELEDFRSALRYVLAYLDDKDRALLESAVVMLDRLNYRVDEVEGRYLVLRENAPVRGWGLYVFDTQAAGALVIEVPAPLDERGSLEAAKVLFHRLSARALAIGGSRRQANPDHSSDVLTERATFYHRFHETVGRGAALQVRATRRAASETHSTSTLSVKSSLPSGLNLALLSAQTGDIEVVWGAHGPANLQREVSQRGFAELNLDRGTINNLVVIGTERQTPLISGTQRIDGYLPEWLLEVGKERIAASGTDQYQPPTIEELLYFDEQILTPLLEIVREKYIAGEGWTSGGLTDLRVLDQAAAVLGYRMVRYQHQVSGSEYVLFAESDTSDRRRYWGSYVFRLGERQPYLIQVPRPLYEQNSLEFGVAQFERLKAAVLMLSGTHPHTNLDGSADVTRPTNATSLFTLVNQVVLREAGDLPMLAVSARAFGRRADGSLPQADALLAFASGADRPDRVPPLARALLEQFDNDGIDTRLVDGSRETMGYEVGAVPQARYLSATANKDFCTIWLSPIVRAAFDQQDDSRTQQAQFDALMIDTRYEDLSTLLAAYDRYAATPEALAEHVERYLEYVDIVTLRRLQVRWPTYRFERLIDRDTRQGFLLAFDEQRRLVLVANLAPRTLGTRLPVVLSASDARSAQGLADVERRAQRFLNSQMALLLFSESV